MCRRNLEHGVPRLDEEDVVPHVGPVHRRGQDGGPPHHLASHLEGGGDYGMERGIYARWTELPGTAVLGAGLCRRDCGLSAAVCPGRRSPAHPVVATTFEVGGQVVRGPAILTASVYRTNVRDDIFFIQSRKRRVRGFFDNIGDTRREGSSWGSRSFHRAAVSLRQLRLHSCHLPQPGSDLQHPGRQRLCRIAVGRAQRGEYG